MQPDPKRRKVDNKEREDAWSDEDDERIQVNLNKNERSLKLREEHEEPEIDGKEFSSRLRKQHKKLTLNDAGWATSENIDPAAGFSHDYVSLYLLQISCAQRDLFWKRANSVSILGKFLLGDSQMPTNRPILA